MTVKSETLTNLGLTWRDEAHAAWIEQKAENEKKERERFAKERRLNIAEFQGHLSSPSGLLLLENLPDTSFSPDGRTLTLSDGTSLYLARYEHRSWLQLLGECPVCHDIVGGDIYSMAQLGGQLESFEPAYHDCWERQRQKGLVEKDQSPPGPTVGEELESIIRSIVNEVLDSRESGAL